MNDPETNVTSISEISRQLRRMEADIDRRFSALERKVDSAVFVSTQVYMSDQRTLDERFKSQDEKFKTLKEDVNGIIDFRSKVYIAFLVAFLAIVGNFLVASVGA